MTNLEWEIRHLIRNHAKWLDSAVWDGLVDIKNIREHAERIVVLVKDLEKLEMTEESMEPDHD